MKGRYKRWLGTRALLNGKGHQTTAAIVCEIEDVRRWEPGERYIPLPDYTFQIANCDRSISFMLDFGSQREHRNNLKKIDTMIKVLQEFREGVAVSQDAYLELKKGRDEE
jgi:hypothetical protein